MPEGEVLERTLDATDGVQDAHRALHDVGQMPPADGVALVGRERINVTVEKTVADRTTDHVERRLDSSSDRLDESRLAATGLAGQSVDLILPDLHGD